MIVIISWSLLVCCAQVQPPEFLTFVTKLDFFLPFFSRRLSAARSGFSARREWHGCFFWKPCAPSYCKPCLRLLTSRFFSKFGLSAQLDRNLMAACHDGNLEMAAMFIDHGANMNSKEYVSK
jgi:hypothetical protein